jgi:hypothetical protein
MAKPERVFKMGAVRASVFRNVIEREGKEVLLPKVVLEVRYRDKSGQWQGTNSLSINDLPKAIAALQQAYEYLLTEGAKPDREDQVIEPSNLTTSPEFASSLPPRRVTTWTPGKTL